MKSLSIYLFAIIFYSNAFSQSLEALIKSKNSDLIVLRDETVFEILSENELIISRKYNAIIKNRYASDYKNIYLFYDQFREITFAEVTISDLSGTVLEKFKIKDFNDVSAGGGSLADDSRAKILKPTLSKYPFKISVSYELKKSGSLHYPIWNPQRDEKIYIKSSNFVVLDNSNNSFRYNSFNLADPEIEDLGNTTSYKWEVENISPFKYEDYNYNIEDYAPIVYTAPTTFQMDGLKGDMTNWNSFGKWMQQLNEGKNDLEIQQLNSLTNLVSKIDSDFEKTKIVYDYLQSSTHYVSIQLGIGGWQPFNSAFVHEKKYGDCKALSFYAHSLLEHYGIESYYTLIRAGNYSAEVDASFPNAHFNHAILSVPINQDTIFLECTSQTKPFGYMGKFTSDRNALMITENGGKIIHTKKYTPEENVQYSKIGVMLQPNGAAKVSLDRNFNGLEIDNYRFRELYAKGESEVNKWLTDSYTLGDMSIIDFELKQLTNEVVPQAGFKANIVTNKEAKRIGSRWFISPGKYFESYLDRLPDSKRTKPIRIRYGYSQVDTLKYTFPENLFPESRPKAVSIISDYGKYIRTLKEGNGEMTIIREFVFNDGVYPAEEYDHFKKFINAVIKEDNRKIVLLDKT